MMSHPATLSLKTTSPTLTPTLTFDIVLKRNSYFLGLWCFQSKEERILELETENAILHLRLAEVRRFSAIHDSKGLKRPTSAALPHWSSLDEHDCNTFAS